MDYLKRDLAPITKNAWEEIDTRVSQIAKYTLTARKLVDVSGPLGFESGGVNTGRLKTPLTQTHSGVNFGIREIQPFIEIRKPFELNIWELDNIDRGSKDINLKSLEKATRQVSLFEDSTIYEGFDPGGVVGLSNNSSHKKVTMPETANEILVEIANQVNNLRKSSVEGPYSLVLSKKLWLKLLKITEGYPILEQLNEIIQGKIIINHNQDTNMLLSGRGGDYELTQGTDIEVGYDGHSSENVKLFLSHAFTFRVLSPESIIVFEA